MKYSLNVFLNLTLFVLVCVSLKLARADGPSSDAWDYINILRANFDSDTTHDVEYHKGEKGLPDVVQINIKRFGGCDHALYSIFATFDPKAPNLVVSYSLYDRTKDDDEAFVLFGNRDPYIEHKLEELDRLIRRKQLDGHGQLRAVNQIRDKLAKSLQQYVLLPLHGNKLGRDIRGAARENIVAQIRSIKDVCAPPAKK